MGCDTLVALAPATRGGRTIFAKNSDRPPREAQGILQAPRRRHPPGTIRRCQYVEIPEVAETWGFVGSRPHWLWGLEHGVNEHRVAIGNEMVFTREPLGSTGLVGMDLVRLGLERAATAPEAIDVITALVETHGQGGSGQPHVDWPYSNSFIVADPREAWILETSGRQWAARPIERLGNVSNGLAIGTGWTHASVDVATHAAERGWWTGPNDRVDFARAYADPNVPAMVACPRRERAAMLLAAKDGNVAVETMRGILRDHHDLGPVHRPRPPDDPNLFTLCMHADPLDNTTASMIATLAEDPDEIHPVWVSLGSPCVGAFVPVWPETAVPAALGCAPAEPDAASPWWRMRLLLSLVERDPVGHGPVVRDRWDGWERAITATTAEAGEAATAQVRAGDPAGARTLLARTASDAVAAYRETTEDLIRALGG